MSREVRRTCNIKVKFATPSEPCVHFDTHRRTRYIAQPTYTRWSRLEKGGNMHVAKAILHLYIDDEFSPT